MKILHLRYCFILKILLCFSSYKTSVYFAIWQLKHDFKLVMITCKSRLTCSFKTSIKLSNLTNLAINYWLVKWDILSWSILFMRQLYDKAQKTLKRQKISIFKTKSFLFLSSRSTPPTCGIQEMLILHFHETCLSSTFSSLKSSNLCTSV